MSYQIGRLIVQRRSMVTAKQGPAQAGPLADRPSSRDFNPPPHGYTVHSTSTIVYENGYQKKNYRPYIRVKCCSRDF